MVTGQAPVTLELRNTPGKKHKPKVVHAYISELTQFMPPRERYKSKIGSQPTMCQVHTGAYVSLLAPGKTDYTACHPRKTTRYILDVVLIITTHTHNRRKSIGKKKQTKKRKEKKQMGAWGQEKKKVNKFWGVYWRVLPPARCHLVF